MPFHFIFVVPFKYRPVDAREFSPDPKELKKNIEEGRGGRLMGGFGSKVKV